MQFEEVKKNKKFPSQYEFSLDVDKDWEAIMYILGDGYLGREPSVFLFTGRNMIISYQDKHMTEGVGYHSKEDIKEYNELLKNFPLEEKMQTLDLEKMNKIIIYPIHEDRLSIVKERIIQITQLFHDALKNDEIVIGSLG